MESLMRRPRAIRETVKKPKGLLMVADGNRVNLTMLECMMEQKGHEVITAANGAEVQSLLKLRGPAIDAIVMDSELPMINVLSFCKNVKADSRLHHVAMIMVTSDTTPARKLSAIEGGFSLVIDKTEQKVLFEAYVEGAMRDAHMRKQMVLEHVRNENALTTMDTSRFNIRTLEQAENLATLLAQAYPEPQRAIVGLMELMTNAIEHGLYQVGYAEKTRLIKNGSWRDEVDRRAGQPEYEGKKVEVIMQRKDHAIFVQVNDPGKGFSWDSYLSIDPARAADGHGRGIAQAYAQSFDDMRYNEAGNKVTAVTYLTTENSHALEW